MRKLEYIICLAFALTGCTTPYKSTSSTMNGVHGDSFIAYTHDNKKNKIPAVVAFYTTAKAIQRPYRIIGKEAVSRYDLIGFHRQNKRIDDIMRSLAASIGGDAVTNITADNQKVEGTVISYEKVLL